MNHLSDNEIKELRSELERELGGLVRSMAITDEALRPVQLDQTAVGRLSRMDSIQNQSLTKNLRERESLKLALIRGALARMERGDYGLCEDCGGPIPFGRLFVVPESPTCAGCG
jgi:DnaK suppressor protein